MANSNWCSSCARRFLITTPCSKEKIVLGWSLYVRFVYSTYIPMRCVKRMKNSCKYQTVHVLHVVLMQVRLTVQQGPSTHEHWFTKYVDLPHLLKRGHGSGSRELNLIYHRRSRSTTLTQMKRQLKTPTVCQGITKANRKYETAVL